MVDATQPSRQKPPIENELHNAFKIIKANKQVVSVGAAKEQSGIGTVSSHH